MAPRRERARVSAMGSDDTMKRLEGGSRLADQAPTRALLPYNYGAATFYCGIRPVAIQDAISRSPSQCCRRKSFLRTNPSLVASGIRKARLICSSLWLVSDARVLFRLSSYNTYGLWGAIWCKSRSVSLIVIT